MREINRAFAVVLQAHAHGTGLSRKSETWAQPLETEPTGPREPSFGRRLSEVELQQIADAIGTPAYFGTLMRYAFWAGSVVVGIGVMVMSPRGEAPKAMNVAAGILLLSAGAGHMLRTLLGKRS